MFDIAADSSWRDCHGYSAPAPNEHRELGRRGTGTQGSNAASTGDQLEAGKDLDGTEDMGDAEEAEDRDGHGNCQEG